ncbi:MAG: DUF3226 domain-containing protein [Chloroflexota bacterium]|nr:DUF3226 domain-containing protein [Chloroflexota bacterium]
MGDAITKPKLLLVEGQDEVHFFGQLLADLDIVDVEIRDIMGKTKFRKRLKGLPDITGFGNVSSVGIVVDADNKPKGTFDSISDALDVSGFPKPIASLQPIGDDLQVTVMVLPGDGRKGMLEDLCLESVADDPAILCVEDYFQCLEEEFESRMLPENPSKSRVRAFLASMGWLEESHFEYFQEHLEEHLHKLPHAPSVSKVQAFLATRYKPDLDLGIAAQKGYWQLNHPAFDGVKQFLKML